MITRGDNLIIGIRLLLRENAAIGESQAESQAGFSYGRVLPDRFYYYRLLVSALFSRAEYILCLYFAP